MGLLVGLLVGSFVGFGVGSSVGSGVGSVNGAEGMEDASLVGVPVGLELDVVDGFDVGVDDKATVGTCDANRDGGVVGRLVGSQVGATVGGLVGGGVVGGCVIREGSLTQ